MMDLKDFVFTGTLIINVIALFINALALFLTRYSIRRQAAAADVGLYFQITEKSTDIWRQYKNAKEKEQDFELAEVLNFLESLAHLYFKRRIHDVTRDMVKEYLLDVVPDIYRHDHTRNILENPPKPDNYSYLRRFAKSNGIKSTTHS